MGYCLETSKETKLYGDTVEYLIPDGQKEKILKKLYPFGSPPAMTQTLMDIHEHKTFVVKDFKVVQQGDYVLLAVERRWYFWYNLAGLEK